MTTPNSPETDPAPKEQNRKRRLQPRHAAYVVLLLIVVASVIALTRTNTSTATDFDGGKIQRLIPSPGAKVLQQDIIGIDLAPGYETTLTLNGTLLPKGEVNEVPELNQVTFKPGPGKLYERLPAGENCLIASYWQSAFGPAVTTLRTWCFSVI